MDVCSAGPSYQHSRRSRLERLEREYDDYPERDMYPHHQHVPPHLQGGQDYRERTQRPPDHRISREEDYSHRGSSRRALNAI